MSFRIGTAVQTAAADARGALRSTHAASRRIHASAWGRREGGSSRSRCRAGMQGRSWFTRCLGTLVWILCWVDVSGGPTAGLAGHTCSERPQSLYKQLTRPGVFRWDGTAVNPSSRDGPSASRTGAGAAQVTAARYSAKGERALAQSAQTYMSFRCRSSVARRRIVVANADKAAFPIAATDCAAVPTCGLRGQRYWGIGNAYAIYDLEPHSG